MNLQKSLQESIGKGLFDHIIVIIVIVRGRTRLKHAHLDEILTFGRIRIGIIDKVQLLHESRNKINHNFLGHGLGSGNVFVVAQSLELPSVKRTFQLIPCINVGHGHKMSIGSNGAGILIVSLQVIDGQERQQGVAATGRLLNLVRAHLTGTIVGDNVRLGTYEKRVHVAIITGHNDHQTISFQQKSPNLRFGWSSWHYHPER
mmetsp:Transcript_25372/g.45952  ORF Transcript_25372/g.45952 Transcript_25372/m.45952 type:complete len:203 (-) Transcript_25372:1106-1714(-)